ncbi:hypothetical protein QYF36_014667 [Acer negundo]|nr:hypothetical protein QYF36_014667 [Acer negundo]
MHKLISLTCFSQDRRLGILYAILAARKIILLLCFAKSKTQKIGTAAVSVMQAGGVGLIFAQSVLQLQNGYLQTIHKLLPFPFTGPSSMSEAVLKDMSHLPGKQPPPWRTPAQHKYQEEGNSDKKGDKMWDKL